MATAAALSALVLNTILVLPGQHHLKAEVQSSILGSSIVAGTDFLQPPLANLLTPGRHEASNSNGL